MRTVACEPGTAIIAGDSFAVSDLFLGWAVRLEKSWGRTVVVDADGRRWIGATILPPSEFELVEGCCGRVPYPAARPLEGHSQAPELALAALRQRVGTPGRGVGQVNRAAREKTRSGLRPKRAFSLHGERSLLQPTHVGHLEG
jgi:hypothetical protein